MSGDDDRTSYIRGGGASFDRGRVARIAVVVLLATLAAIGIVFVVDAADHNRRLADLQHRGVHVDVTITRCIGNATGTGITVLGYTCTGSYRLDGVSYTSHITGNADKHLPGEILHAVADPHDPKNVAIAQYVASGRPSWHAYAVGGVVLAVTLVLAVVAGLYTRRTSRITRDG